MIVIYGLLALVVICEFPTLVAYGWFVSKETSDFYMNLDESQIIFNMYSTSILQTKDYISYVPFSVISKYYIEGRGIVPRWSKLHKRIEEYFVIATRKAEKLNETN